MNILVINIALRSNSRIKLFPTGLGYITTAMKNAGFDFDLIDIDAHRHSDDEVEKLIARKKYDVVCMGCIVTGYKIVKALTLTVRQYHPYCKIIVGNSVATSIADILLTRTEADVAVMAEGDETIVDLLCAISESRPLEEVHGICYKDGNRIVKTPPRDIIKNISSLPFVDFDIFDIETYIENAKYEVSDPLPISRERVRALPVNTARGCVFGCTFCYHVFKGYPYRYRTAESIVDEIKSLIDKYSLNYIHFWDELTFFSKRQAIELVQQILDEDVHFYWTALCKANLFTKDSDIEIIRKMKKAGCLGMGYSLESADEGILKAMNKKITIEQFSKQTQLYQNVGIATWTSLVIGYPQETRETIKKTFDCCIENKIYPSAGYLLPQPGSVMYDYALEHGFVEDEEDYLLRLGDRQDLRINLTQMSDEQLQSCVIEGLNRCNERLGIGLDSNHLIKTQYYRAARYEDNSRPAENILAKTTKTPDRKLLQQLSHSRQKLEKPKAQASMKFVDYSEIPTQMWDEFCSRSSTAWFVHTSTWIDFSLNLRYGGDNSNRSFAVFENKQIVCAVPLIERNIDSAGLREFSYGGLWTPYPAFSNDISSNRRKKIEKLVFEKVLKIRGITCMDFYVPPLIDGVLSRDITTNPFSAYGFQDTTISTNILILNKTEPQLLRGIRKGHKSDIKAAIKNGYQVDIINSDNLDDDKFNAYRQIHFEAAQKRQTRPDRTWEIMQDWIANDLAIMALCGKNGKYIGVAFADAYIRKAYYHSGAILPEHKAGRGVGHLIQWEIIKYLNAHGFTHYELGWNWHPNISQEVADEKKLGISRFKAGFGGDKYPLFRGQYFHDLEYMRRIYLERLNSYIDKSREAGGGNDKTMEK